MSYNVATDIRFSVDQPELASETTKIRAGFGKLPFVILLVFSAFIAVDRFAVPQVPINVDPASYAVISHELLAGKSLYTDIWDHKPPAVFIAYGAAELLFGYSPQTLVILNFLVSLVTLLGIYYAGRTGRGGVISGLWAAGLWVIVAGIFQLESRDPNTEPFLNACMVWAFALLAVNRTDGLKPKTSIIIGLLFLLASFFKPIVVAIALAFVCGHIIFSSNRKKALSDSLLIGSVGVAGWIALFGYFAVTGRLSIFYETIVSYNRFYSGDMLENLLAPLNHQAELFPDFINSLPIFAIAGVVFTIANNLRQAALLAAFIGSSWIAIALPGRFSVHYYQLWLPPLIIGSSLAIGFLAVSKRLHFRIFSYAAGLFLAGTLIFNQVTPYRSVLAKEWTPFIPVLNAGEDIAKKINALLALDETFFLWGNTPSLYLLSGRRPATPVLFNTHFIESPMSEILKKRVADDLATNRPELLVTENGLVKVPDWIARNYDATPIFQDNKSYSFYVLRGGNLAKRLESSGK